LIDERLGKKAAERLPRLRKHRARRASQFLMQSGGWFMLAPEVIVKTAARPAKDWNFTT
jgi:hypothetical protein